MGYGFRARGPRGSGFRLQAELQALGFRALWVAWAFRELYFIQGVGGVAVVVVVAVIAAASVLLENNW